MTGQASPVQAARRDAPPENPPHVPMKAVIEAFGEAVGQFSHVIRDTPELVFPLLYNRLQGQTDELPGLDDRLARGRSVFKSPWLRLLSRAAIQRSLIRTFVGEGGLVVVSALSPDGNKLVSSGCGRPKGEFVPSIIRIWDTETGREIAAIQNHLQDIVLGLVFTRDGKRFLSFSMGRAAVRSAATGEILHEFDAVGYGVWRHPERSLSPCGRSIAVSTPDGFIKIMDLDTGEEKAKLRGYRGEAFEISYSPDGARIAARLPGRVMMWDASTGKPIWSSKMAKTGRLCSISPDGSRVLVARRGGADCGDVHDLIDLLDAETGRQVAAPEGYRNELNDCTFSPDGKRIAMAGAEGLIFIWDGKTGQRLGESCGNWGPIAACAFSPDSRILASCCGEYYGNMECAIDLWDAATMKKIASLTGHSSHIEDCRYSPDGRLLLSTGADGEIKLWDAAKAERAGIPDRHDSWVSACRFSPDGRRVVSSSDDRTVRVWDAFSGQSQLTLRGHAEQVLDCWFAPDGKSILSGAGGNDPLIVWDVAQGRERARLDSIRAAPFAPSPDGRYLADATSSQYWDIQDLDKPISFPLEKHEGLKQACVSPDGSLIAAAGRDGSIVIWDSASGRKASVFKGHDKRALSCAFSPDSRAILTSDKEGNLRLWDSRTGEKLMDWPGHGQAIRSCGISPDGRMALCGGNDKTLRLWDISTGKLILSFKGFSGAILSCSFSPDGTRIAAGDTQGQVLIYGIEMDYQDRDGDGSRPSERGYSA